MGETAPMRVRLPGGARPPALAGLSAGGWHSAAVVAESGALLAWGNNHFGQLGDGRFTCEETPGGGHHDALEPAPTLLREGVAAASLGHYHSLALLRNGSVLAWGSNQAGQLGAPADAPAMLVPAPRPPPSASPRPRPRPRPRASRRTRRGGRCTRTRAFRSARRRRSRSSSSAPRGARGPAPCPSLRASRTPAA